MKNDQEIAENNFQCPQRIVMQTLHNTSIPAGPHYYQPHPLPQNNPVHNRTDFPYIFLRIREGA